jgi:hypothetical protein
MKTWRVIFGLARADFLERVRRYSFFLTMMFALGLGYGAATGKISVNMQGYRGVYTSAWIGSLVALITTCFVTLVGFYIIKSSVDLDRQTGVGQILAATPMSKASYALGKFLSNFGVLSAMVAVLGICALGMQIFAREDRHIDAMALLAPFVLVALPAMALTAAIAVLFEMLPILRGGAGNVIWFFVWVFGGLALSDLSGKAWLDPMGFGVVSHSMMDAARKVIPDYKNGFALDISPDRVQLLQSLRWHGVDWTAQSVGLRMAWFAFAIVLALLAAVFFDRFDGSRRLNFSLRRVRTAKCAGAEEASGSAAAFSGAIISGAMAASAAIGSVGDRQLHLSALPVAGRNVGIFGAFGRVFEAELRLALQGQRWWWYAVAAGLLIAEFFSPLEAARGPLLGIAWIWPVLIWSAMGARETRFATRGLLFSSSGILARQLPACFLAGVAVAVIAGAGVGVRLLVVGHDAEFAAWAAGALFLPALAISLGVTSGSGKAFEALLTAMCYIGPLNHTPGLDYTGSANGAATLRYAGIYLAMSAALLLIAFLARARQLRHN